MFRTMLHLIILLLGGIVVSANQLHDQLEWTEVHSGEFNESGWTAFGGSDAHTGYKADQLGPIDGLKRKWSVNVTGTLTYPIVYDNKVFVMSSAGVLHVFDELTGVQLGLLNIGGGYYVGPPTIGNDGEDDLVYVQYVGTSEGIVVYAVNIRHVFRMRVKWTATGSAQWSSFPYGVVSSKSSGLMYFPGGEYGGVMYGVDYTTGETKFDSQLYDTGFGCDTWAPTVDEQERVFFSAGTGEGNPGYIGEVDPFSGEVMWKYSLTTYWFGYSTYWVPVVYDNTALAVVFASSGMASLVAVHVVTHTMLWTTDVYSVKDIDVTPAVDGAHVFFSSTDGVRSFSLLTGRMIKNYQPCNGCFGQPIVTDDYLFAQSSSGAVVFDKTTGDRVAEVTDGSGKMAYNAGSLYVSVQETLFAYETY